MTAVARLRKYPAVAWVAGCLLTGSFLEVARWLIR